MAEKLLKTKKRKIAAKKSATNGDANAATNGGADGVAGRAASTKPPQEIALVATYREKQLAWIKKNGVYNYPVNEGDAFDAAAFGRIKELWLYAGSKGKRHCFAAEFVGKMTRDEFLAANPTYADVGRAASTKPPRAPNGRAASTKPPHAAYYVFKTSFLDYGPKLDNPQVVIRAMDFATGRGRARLVKKAFDQYKQDGEFAPLAAYLPSALSAVPRQQLRVCEAAVQMEFFDELFVCDRRLPEFVMTHPERMVENSMIDLFSGAGGLSEGLEEAGFHSVFASEIMPQYAETYHVNHPSTTVVTKDIRKLDAEEVRRQLRMEKGQLTLIAGGPPCQGFSINAPIRSVLDQRNHLFKEYLRFVDAFQPRAVLIENVPGLVSFEDGDTLHAILNSLGALGYGADVRILGAAYYGVPQMRWRTVILGLRGKELPHNAFPEPVCHAPIRPNFTATFDGHSLLKVPAADIPGNFVSVKEAIGDLPHHDSCEPMLIAA